MSIDIKQIAKEMLNLPRMDIELKALSYEQQMRDMGYQMDDPNQIAVFLRVYLKLNGIDNLPLVENLTAVIWAMRHMLKGD